MSKRGIVIAIDGVSGSGKGKLASELASHYKCEFLPTGNLYRIVAKHCIERNIDISKDDILVGIVSGINSKDLYSDKLHDERISDMASKISTNPSLRAALNKFQIDWISNRAFCIVEGRDIGTKICPDADVKLYLSADAKIRAKRRCADLNNAGISFNEQGVYESLIERDSRDMNRIVSPLKPAKDSYSIDTTNIGVEEMVLRAINIIEKKLTIL